VGVQRQYTGTAGRIENAQVAVYLTYAAARGHALIDRELYLPQSWTSDPDRLAEAGVPDDIGFATKPALATGMLRRTLRAGVLARWVTGDEVYGNDPGLRAECEIQRIGYVLAIGCDRRVPTPAGPVRADALVAGLPRWAWWSRETPELARRGDPAEPPPHGVSAQGIHHGRLPRPTRPVSGGTRRAARGCGRAGGPRPVRPPPAP